MSNPTPIGSIVHSMGHPKTSSRAFDSRPSVKTAEKLRKNDVKTTEKLRKNDVKTTVKTAEKLPPSACTLGEALAVVATLSAAYPGKFPLETGKLWASKMLRFTPDVLHAAAHQMIEETEWPSIAAMLSRCAEVQRRRAAMGQRYLAPPTTTFAPDLARATRWAWEDLRTGRISPNEIEHSINEYRRTQTLCAGQTRTQLGKNPADPGAGAALSLDCDQGAVSTGLQSDRRNGEQGSANVRDSNAPIETWGG